MKNVIILGILLVLLFSIIVFVNEQIEKQKCYDLPISETYKHSECDKYWGN